MAVERYRLKNFGVIKRADCFIKNNKMTITCYCLVKLENIYEQFFSSNIKSYLHSKISPNAIHKKLKSRFTNIYYSDNSIITFAFNHNLNKITWTSNPIKPNYVINIIFNIPHYITDNETYFEDILNEIQELNIFESDNIIKFIEVDNNGRPTNT